MKLVRYGMRGAEKPGLIDADGGLRDLSHHLSDVTGLTLDDYTLGRIGSIDPSELPPVEGEVRFGAPLTRIGHFIAIGLNYADHAEESGMPIPAEPVVFSKAPSSVTGPNDDIVHHPGVTKLDWEVELAAVIGRRAWQVDEASALSHVAGYTICNDISERAWQLEGTGQWIKGKSAPGFGPLGPWLVTADEVENPQALDLWLDVNGERMQTGNTETMIFSVAEIVSYLSRQMSLEPGDVITTGTPPGVGMGKSPPKYLRPGDTVTLAIEGLGEQRQRIVAAR
ncbi:fumarylacetoacetate hydrolase family protein [Rhizobiales bacterium]|uniref:fumarylacetoacetate hydrolase family protein n=1 Tax=Hongsoonwoonella zoysiae TaxID=2821844 RepID=UPI0015612599|nr:fumarylacetoacetate hydrolase family protein [Hongsoonwoonella zoysiae]NRG17971.1 fumarylacetoacetate hydrolase family protein [Hongsoonwoonella zoysiae]